jgi:hypothetical protein
MLADRPEETLHWGRRAAELAQRAGDDAARAHALINIGTVESGRDPDDTAALDAAHRLADACGDRHEAVRALANGAWSQLLWLRPAEARRRAEQAAGYARAHEVDTLGDYVEVTLAWLRLREGDWTAAATPTRSPGWTSWPARPTGPGSCSASSRCSSSRWSGR